MSLVLLARASRAWKQALFIVEQIWACDFLPVTDLLFRSLSAFFIIELRSRKVIHVGVTRAPTDAWVARIAARSHGVPMLHAWESEAFPKPYGIRMRGIKV